MTYEQLLKNAPDHNSPEFLDYLREHNEVVSEYEDWLIIKNIKYGWHTAFAKISCPSISILLTRYPNHEWKVKPASKRTVKRFHIHLIADNQEEC